MPGLDEFDSNWKRGEPDDPDKVAAALTPEDALKLSIQCFATLTEIGDFAVPGWRTRGIIRLCETMRFLGSTDVGREFAMMGLISICMFSRLVVEAREKIEYEEAEDDAVEMSDPRYLLEGLIESLPPGEYFDDIFQVVKDEVFNRDQIQQLEDLFNLPSGGEEDAKSE